MHWRRLKVHSSSRIHHRLFLLLRWTGSHLFPGMKASCFRSRIVEMDFFIPFPLLNFGVNFSLPFRSRLLGMFFFHASSVPKLWNGIFHSLSHLRKSKSLSSLLGFVAYPSFSLFLEMEFSIPFPICEKVNPSHPCWGLLLILRFPCSYICISRSPPYIGRQQWIYGGGCSWYFVPLSTLILMLVSCTSLSLFLPIFECPHI